MNRSNKRSGKKLAVEEHEKTKDIHELISELGDKNKSTCRDAYATLKNMGELVLQPLVDALTNPQEQIRWRALRLLNEINIEWTAYVDENTIDALISELGGKNGFTRMRARNALIRTGPRAVGALVHALNEQEGVKRWEAAKALSQIGDPTATRALIQALSDKTFEIRWLASEGLISIGEPAIIPLLNELIRNADSEWLKEGAHHIFHATGNERTAEILEPVLRAVEDVDSENTLELPLVAEAAINKLRESK